SECACKNLNLEEGMLVKDGLLEMLLEDGKFGYQLQDGGNSVRLRGTEFTMWFISCGCALLVSLLLVAVMFQLKAASSSLSLRMLYKVMMDVAFENIKLCNLIVLD
ncbi:Hypothetical predicted protein, partial [Prunus dulcis]